MRGIFAAGPGPSTGGPLTPRASSACTMGLSSTFAAMAGELKDRMGKRDMLARVPVVSGNVRASVFAQWTLYWVFYADDLMWKCGSVNWAFASNVSTVCMVNCREFTGKCRVAEEALVGNC